ncbi:hypothetical protein C0J52_13346 [Blattella germanica]|nr:hypothetical protein C0J52_13346 [Blattella germanica]
MMVRFLLLVLAILFLVCCSFADDPTTMEVDESTTIEVDESTTTELDELPATEVDEPMCNPPCRRWAFCFEGQCMPWLP